MIGGFEIVVVPKCHLCNGEIHWIPERNQPPLIRLWCDDCGDFTLYCQICLLKTNDPKHICHFQRTLFLKIPFTYMLDAQTQFMSDWEPYGGPRNDETKELCPDCEGTSQCLLCCMHWDPKKKE